jgi:hypothetical protein
VRGEATLVVRVDKHGKPVLGHPRIRDRLYAAKVLIEHGYGKPPREIQLEDAQPRLTGAQVMADIVELLPRVVAMLPADTREELARRLAEQRAIEGLVSGQEVKDAGVATETR